MATTAQYRMADRLAGGELARLLRELRASDASYEAIARQLYSDYGIEVTRQTVANWVNELDIDEAAS
jgi:intein-encoded DNA endonuclease-like protein